MTQKTWGFFITTYCSKEEHLESLMNCVDSIVKFHPDKKVIVVDDFSPLDTNIFNYENVEWMRPPYKAAEMAGYAIFIDNKFFDVCISLHDSVVLKKALPDLSEIDCKTVWSWSKYLSEDYASITYYEPQNEYNEKFNIKTNEDLINHLVSSSIPECEFKEYFNVMLEQNSKWLGSVGMMLIISHDFLKDFENKTHILKIAKNCKDRRDRMAMETIMGVAIKYAKRWVNKKDYIFDIDFMEREREIGASPFNNYDASEYLVKFNFDR